MGLLSGCPQGPPCETERQELGFEEVSPAGFSAGERLRRVEGTYVDTIRWLDDEAALTLVIEGNGEEAGWVQSTPGRGSPEDAVCPDWLEFPGVVTLETADGTFSETWEVWLIAEEDSEDPAVFRHIERPMDLTGDYLLRGLSPWLHEGVVIEVRVAVDGEESRGTVWERGSRWVRRWEGRLDWIREEIRVGAWP